MTGPAEEASRIAAEEYARDIDMYNMHRGSF